MRKLSMRILELIGEGLGVQFNNELIKSQTLVVNHYPSSANGKPAHCDPNLKTFIQQQVYGLEIFKGGHWIGDHPLPYAFVVNIFYQQEIISNNKLVAGEHHAITNPETARTSIGTFAGPLGDCIVEPTKALVNGGSPALFRAFKYHEFLDDYIAKKDPI
ncbi:hyoscyamine 6-dioxygenase-like [Lycium ferocissimum]|uniref:hyoscyamine 6-dioxygenase-like n=1 Tax=Lycium ferocissimum TaxID=112874 RepID=UPI002815BDD3|nr:hyoscyamine 6-dioxygenase-like [Lycium ferocissimum]